MSDATDMTAIGPDADPALLTDKPMTYPPTGNPRVCGPGRGRTADRVSLLLHAAAAILLVLLPTGFCTATTSGRASTCSPQDTLQYTPSSR